MKQILILLYLLIYVGAQSQNLEQFISNDSKAVVEVSGDQIFSLIDHADLELLMPPDESGMPMSLEQYGIDIKAKAYYFYQEVDDIGYQNMVVRLADADKAEELIRSMSGSMAKEVNGYNFVLEANMSAAWNDKVAIFSSAEFPKKLYTMDDLLAEQEEERKRNAAAEAAAAAPSAVSGVKEAGQGESNALDEAVDAVAEAEYEAEYEYEEEEQSQEMLEMQLMFKNMDAPSMFSDAEISKRMADHFSSIANNKKNNSISQNASYTSGKNSRSSVYFWVSSIDGLMKDSYPTELASLLGASPGDASGMITGMEEMSGNLIFDTEEIKLDFNLGINPKLASVYRKMYESKMAPAFFNHFNENDALSYMSFTVDMATMLKEYPEMAKTMYGSLIPGYEEEMDVAMDLVEVFLDEDAIGELITGDGLFILHDFEEKEMTYKTVEYDDDFNATEVEGTKMESIPNFSVMLGSENERIIDKLMKLAGKYEAASNTGKYYQINSTDMEAPFDMYFAHQNGIIFLTNSEDRIGSFVSGKKRGQLGKHKNMLENNLFNVYLDVSSTMGNVSSLVPLDPETMEYVQDNYKEMFLTVGPMVGDDIGYDMVIKTNSGAGNSLKLILDTFKSMSGM